MIDWAAKWFEIRAEMGQSDLATFMYTGPEQKLVKVHFRHRETDGFGKIVSLLESEDLQVQAPTRTLKKPATFLQPYLLLKGILTHPKLRHNPWKKFDLKVTTAPVENVCSWHLSPIENKTLKDQAKNKNLNVGFYILSLMDEIVRQNLYQTPEDSSHWLCPVDVRGAFPEATLNRNWVSFIVTKFSGTTGDKNIQKAFKKYRQDLKSGLYWAYWELYQIGKWIGIKGMKHLARRAHNKSFWTGSFSDLGSWNQKELLQSHACNRHWIMAPPGSTSYPIGITTIEWCHQRSITLKIHPAICEGSNQEVAEKLMGLFKEKVQHFPT